MKRSDRMAKERAATAALLKRVGYDRSKRRGPSLPDLSCGPENAPLGNGFGAPGAIAPKTHTTKVPAGYMIGNSHKQGLSVMPLREAQWAGGKKS